MWWSLLKRSFDLFFLYKYLFYDTIFVVINVLDIILDTLIDLVKLVPFLFLAFLMMEFIEHKMENKSKILKSKKVGPLFGSLLGVIPQCGFSVLATNLFSSRIISIGTLVAIYLSTSDEMLPILISGGAPFKTIIYILLTKILVGIIFGYLIDFILRKKKEKKADKEFHVCEEDDCHCEEGSILKSSIIHTLKIIIFILITTFLINTLIYYLGEDKISELLLKNNFFGPFLASLVGLIPNCAASIIITELYMSGLITSGMMMAGLLTGSGIGLMILFKVNKNIKENIYILLGLYGIGVLIGIIIDLIGIVF